MRYSQLEPQRSVHQLEVTTRFLHASFLRSYAGNNSPDKALCVFQEKKTQGNKKQKFVFFYRRDCFLQCSLKRSFVLVAVRRAPHNSHERRQVGIGSSGRPRQRNSALQVRAKHPIQSVFTQRTKTPFLFSSNFKTQQKYVVLTFAKKFPPFATQNRVHRHWKHYPPVLKKHKK
jgi:hypothetical protein